MSIKACSEFQILGRRYSPYEHCGCWYLGDVVDGGGFREWKKLGIARPKKFIRSLGIVLPDLDPFPGERWDSPWLASWGDVVQVASYLKALDSARLAGLLEGVE